MWVCYHDYSKLRASILTKLGLYGKGSDHLQLIKFWLSRAPGKGVCGRAAGEFFWLRLTTASAQCNFSSERFLPARRSKRGMLRRRGWVAGWLGVRHTPVWYQNGKTYLKTFSTI